MPVTKFPPFVPYEERERYDRPEVVELRELVDNYDNLFEDCMNKALSKEEAADLDDLISFLMLKEQEMWDGVPGETVEMITSHSEADFPLIRQTLGIMPNEY